MDNYFLYVGVVIATVCLPGPAVLLTINNAIQYGLLKAFAGGVGIALAILLVATISATSLGIILASSAMAFNAIKIVGAVYLIYLGIKMWRSKASHHVNTHIPSKPLLKCFIEGFLVSITNPKAIVFFMSIFPQFIDVNQAYAPQFILLALTFSTVVVIVHAGYALFALKTKSKLSRPAGAQSEDMASTEAAQHGNPLLSKISGGVFIAFGIGLAASSK